MDHPHIVGRLCTLMPALEAVAVVAHTQGVHLTTTRDGAAVTAAQGMHLIAREMDVISASGSLVLGYDELLDVMRSVMGERLGRTQDRRCFAITVNDSGVAELSIDGSGPISLPAPRGQALPDFGPVEPTRAMVSHVDFLHAVPRHLARRVLMPVPYNRLAFEVTPDSVAVVAQDRHATTVTTMRAEMAQVATTDGAIELAPHIVDALRHGNRDGYIAIGWKDDDRGRSRVTLRSGKLTIRTGSLPVVPLTNPIPLATHPEPRAIARFRGSALRTKIETMVQGYAKELHVTDVTLVIRLIANGGLTLCALRDGKPDFAHGEVLAAYGDGPETTVCVAASRLRHALDQLDACATTLSVSGADKPLVLTERGEARVLVVPQAREHQGG